VRVQPQDLPCLSLFVHDVRTYLQHARTHGEDHLLSQGCKFLKQIDAVHCECDVNLRDIRARVSRYLLSSLTIECSLSLCNHTINCQVPKGDPINVLQRGQEKKIHEWCGTLSNCLCVCFCTPLHFLWPCSCQFLISTVYNVVCATEDSVNKMDRQKYTGMQWRRKCDSWSRWVWDRSL
jgi:hypothetical protein